MNRRVNGTTHELLFWKGIIQEMEQLWRLMWGFILKSNREKERVWQVIWAFILKSNLWLVEVTMRQKIYFEKWYVTRAFILKSDPRKVFNMRRELLIWKVITWYRSSYETWALFWNIRARGAWLKSTRQAPSWLGSLQGCSGAVPVWLAVVSRAVGPETPEQHYGDSRALTGSSSK